MDSGGEAALIIFFLALLLLLIFLCCYKDRRLVYPWVKWPKIKSLLWKKVVLVKRCEQDNQEVRISERQIIERMNLEEKIWGQQINDGKIPVLVFCVNASRIGTDIESALKDVQGFNPVIMVVLHCINKSSLRGDLSDNTNLLDQALRNRVAGIAHFAFSDYGGLYSCQQNEDGFRMLDYIFAELEKKP